MIAFRIFMAIAGVYAGVKLGVLGIKWLREGFRGLDPKNFREENRKEEDEW